MMMKLCLLNKFSIFYCCEWPSLNISHTTFVLLLYSLLLKVLLLLKKIYINIFLSPSLTHIKQLTTSSKYQQIVSLNSKIEIPCWLSFISLLPFFFFFFLFLGISNSIFYSPSLVLFVHHQLANAVYSWKISGKKFYSSHYFCEY